MSYNGWLIKFVKTNSLFPHKYIEKSTYKSTPLQRTEIKAYRDNNNLLHRVTSPNYKTKIEFSTYELNLQELTQIQNAVRSAMDNYQQRKIRLTYWDDEILSYRTATFYMPDKTYNVITISPQSIKYAAVPFTFIEY